MVDNNTNNYPTELDSRHVDGDHPVRAAAPITALMAATTLPNASARTDSPANQAVATIEQIEASIPPDASCIFHIYDRRVNLDARVVLRDGRVECSESTQASSASTWPMYALLRAWVQDDPTRFGIFPGSQLVEEEIIYPKWERRQAQRILDEKHQRTKKAQITNNTDHVTPVMTTRAAVIDTTSCTHTAAVAVAAGGSVHELHQEMMQRALDIRKRKRAEFEMNDLIAVKRLERRGIHLKPLNNQRGNVP